MRFLSVGLFAMLAACGGDDGDGGSNGTTGGSEPDADTDSDADADTDSDADTDADTDTPPVDSGTPVTGCDPVTSGDWMVDGQAFGMPMGVRLMFDKGQCGFILDDWSMVMGSVPTGGHVAGDQVTLTGDPYWQTCTGTVVNGDEIQGVCSQDGADFMMGLR